MLPEIAPLQTRKARSKIHSSRREGRNAACFVLGSVGRSKQRPDWLSALATTSGRLKNEFRYDFWDQPSGGGNRTYQLGGNKGLEFITSSRTQLLVGVPIYTVQSPNGPAWPKRAIWLLSGAVSNVCESDDFTVLRLSSKAL